MTIKIYTTTNCMQCKMTKQFLDKENISYESINLTEDEKATQYVKETLGYSSVPVIETDFIGTFQGFQPSKLKEIVQYIKNKE